MNYLELMAKLGLDIGWRAVLVGWEGPGKCPPLLTVKDVRDFAERRVAVEAPPPPETLALAIADDDEAREVNANLRTLAERDPADPKRELRKWRLVLLNEVMAALPESPLYGLLRLTEFWDQFGFPNDSPHVVQGRGNQVSPEDYYSEKNFRDIVHKHEEWVAAETRELSEPVRIFV